MRANVSITALCRSRSVARVVDNFYVQIACENLLVGEGIYTWAKARTQKDTLFPARSHSQLSVPRPIFVFVIIRIIRRVER